MSDQKTEQKPDHEKRIREALEAGPTEGPFEVVRDSTYSYDIKTTDAYIVATTHGYVGDQLTSRPMAEFIAACNPAAIRALLADLDAVRVKAARYDYLSERLVGADFDWNESGVQVLVFKVEPGTQVWATADKTIDGAMAALKGATA